MKLSERCGVQRVKVGHYRGFDIYFAYQTELDGSAFSDSMGSTWFEGVNMINWQIPVGERRTGNHIYKLQDTIDYTLDRQFTKKTA